MSEPQVLRPDWPAPAGVRAVCSTRRGGVSKPPWDSFNLGDHVGDDARAVAANRARYAGLLGARPVFLRQVHGTGVLRLDTGSEDGLEADACVSSVPGLACTMLVADCLPVLLCDDAGRAVAAAHAGWRGLAGGVLEACCHALAGELGGELESLAPRLMVWLGPCIGPRAFEVGPEVRAAFATRDPDAAAMFAPLAGDKWLADLAGLARRQLAALGVQRVHGNDGTPNWCTVSQSSLFFSHRRDRVSGRFAASIWRV